jgi:ABC-2 type transport system permease protein/lipopolysaccharide transport system permease protein
LLDACAAFTASEGIIRQLRAPLSVHVFRMVWRNVIILAHNLLVYVVIVIAFDVHVGAATLLVIPGVTLVCLNGVWIGLLFGSLNARFRDFHPIMAAVVQVFFFITPIMWKPEQLADQRIVLELNPFFYLVDIVRTPLLGGAPDVSTWLVVLAITSVGSAVTFLFFKRFRPRVAFWL